MGRLTIGFGAVLVLVGIAGYVSTGAASATALIPAFIGVPMVAAGWMIGRPNLQKIGLYSAIVLAAVMALGSLRGVVGLLAGDPSGASLLQLFLFLASLIFVVVALGAVLTGGRGGPRPTRA